LGGWLDFRNGKEIAEPYLRDSPVTEWNPTPFIHILPIHCIGYTILHPYKTGKIMGYMFSCILIRRYLERRQGDELLLRFI
jgi:hypothetical protein